MAGDIYTRVTVHICKELKETLQTIQLTAENVITYFPKDLQMALRHIKNAHHEND